MRRNERFENRQTKRQEAEMRAAHLAGMLLLGAADLTAQGRPSTPARAAEPVARAARRVVVCIPDRKLALVVNGELERSHFYKKCQQAGIDLRALCRGN